MENSIKKNFVYSSMVTFLNAIFPLITYPYITRILGVENMGKIGLVTAVSNYFIVLAQVGIPLYGTREIAKAKKNPIKLKAIIAELMSISVMFSLASFLFYIIIVFTVPMYHNEYRLFLIYSILILNTIFSFEWLFQGVENFKYIGIRNLVLKIVTLVLIFLFVKSRNDIIIYASLLILASVAISILNLYYAIRVIRPSWHQINIIRHIKPLFFVSLINVFITIYTNMDVIVLRAYFQNIEIGYYTVAIKLIRMTTAFIASFSAVMLPRISSMIALNESDACRKTMQKSFSLVIFFSFPCFLGMIAVAADMISVFAGPEYNPAVRLLIIGSPIILFVSISNYFQMQLFLPFGRENSLVIVFGFAILITLGSMLVLVPHNGSLGAIIAMSIGELSVLVAEIFVYRIKMISQYIKYKQIITCIIAGLIMMAIVIMFSKFKINPLFRLLCSLFIGGSSYMIATYCMGNETAASVVGLIKNKIRAKK